MRIMSRLCLRIRKWNQLSQFRWTSTKVIPTENVYMNPCFITLFNQISNLAMGWNFHTFHPFLPQQLPNFCTTLLFDQLHAKEVYFSSFVTKSNQASDRYWPDVFSSFYRIATRGEPNRIFTTPVKKFFITFHYRDSSFGYFCIFFPHYDPPSPLQIIYKISIGPYDYDRHMREHNNIHKHNQTIQETQTQSILLFLLLVLN